MRIPHRPSQRKAQTPTALTPAAGPSLEPWQVRSWFTQAAQLYRSPAAQRLAVLHHLDLKLMLTRSPEPWLMLQDLARCLEQEVQP
jgi:hypothetical protein